MSPAIHIAKSGARAAPTLPADAVTRTFGVFGTKDSGKTNTAKVLVEGICATGGHAIVFDPVGVHWGLTRAGEGPGISGVVVGGEHGDVPLEETGGKLIAELALSRQYPLIVVDMQMLRKGAMRRFLADCLEELYHRNRMPLSVVFEEADQVLPQNPRGMDPTLGRVLGAAEDIVKLGRSRGLGGALISQRLATVNKNVTEQIENLILLRMVGPNDLKAVKEWVQSNGDPAATQRVLDSIAKLEQGEAWMYSPGWLKLLERIRVRHARTLDSSATPTNDQAVAQESAKRAPISLDDLREQMAQSIERAKENDPGELRKRIVALERELAERGEAPAGEKVIVPDRTLMGELSELVASMQAGTEELATARECILDARAQFVREADGALNTLDALLTSAGDTTRQARAYLDTAGGLPVEGISPRLVRQMSEHGAPATPRPSVPAQANGNGRVSGPQQRILDTIAWFASIGVPEPRKAPLAMMSAVSSKSSGYRANLSALSSQGLIEYPAPGRVTYTAEGERQARHPARAGSEAELQEGIMRMVSGPQATLLRELIAEYPSAVERESLAVRAGVSPASSGFRANLSTLSSLELVDYPASGYVRASELLFVRR